MSDRCKKLEKQLAKQQYTNITVSETGSCIRLEGEHDSWEDIVQIGRRAAKLGYKGVLNDITLKGFVPPAIRASNKRDNALAQKQPDVLVIGGGVIGCSIARELAKWDLDILLVEKESDVAMHASSRNDGMIHPGIASHPGTLRGDLNVKGNEMYTQLCRDLSVPFERLSNFILYANPLFGFGARFYLMHRAKKFGIPGRQVKRPLLTQLEPNLTDEARGAFEFPTSGVLSPYKLTVALAENAVENGVQISFDTIVEDILTKNGKIESVVTNRGTLHPRLVINAAGVFSDIVAEMAGDRFFSIHPRKGQCAILDTKQGPRVQRSMGLVGMSILTSDTKGGGVMRTIDGNVLVGPDAYEQPLREDFSTSRENMDALLNKHLKLIKGFSKADVITYFAGIRAATYEEEFVIEASEKVQNLVHAAGIQSPGLAAAPAIAERIVQLSLPRLRQTMQVAPNDAFNPVRNAAPVLAKMTLAEKQALIKANPNYGIVVCRCEGISKGEIEAAVNSPVPATSIDAVKRRVRPGMGRCQGGFCMPLVTQIIAEQTGVAMEQVTKSGGDSELLVQTSGEEAV